MRFCRQYLLALLVLTNSVWAAEPALTDVARAQMQAEQGKKQEFAGVLQRYLSAAPARGRQLDESVGRLYNLAFAEVEEKLPDSATVGLSAWQEALAPLRSLSLPPAVVTSMKALEQSLKQATLALSAIPLFATAAQRRLERQQALIAAATALGALGQQALNLNAQLEAEARRAASDARLLGVQTLMLPAPAKDTP